MNDFANLKPFFLADEVQDSLVEFEPDSSPCRLLVVKAAGDRSTLMASCRKSFESLAPGGYLGVAFEIPLQGKARRLAQFFTLGRRCAIAEKMLRLCGANLAGRFGIAPDLTSPTIVYPLGTAAARYAEKQLLFGPSGRMGAVLSWVFCRWSGCHPSLGGVLVLGRKP